MGGLELDILAGGGGGGGIGEPVDLTGVVDGDLIRRDGGIWKPESPADLPVSTAQAAADALKVSKSGDTMSGRLTANGGVMLPRNTGTAADLTFGASTLGFWGVDNLFPAHLYLKIKNVTVLDVLRGAAGAFKIKDIPLRAEAGFSSGAYATSTNGDYLFLQGGGLVVADSTAAALTLYLGDDVSDPVFLSYLEGSELCVVDEKGTATTNNIVVDASYSSPMDGNTTATINADHGYFRLRVMDSQWKILDSKGCVFA